MAIKTYEQIKKEHPYETFIEAVGKVSAFFLDHPRPIGQADMEQLRADSPLAFELFFSIMAHGFPEPE